MSLRQALWSAVVAVAAILFDTAVWMSQMSVSQRLAATGGILIGAVLVALIAFIE